MREKGEDGIAAENEKRTPAAPVGDRPALVAAPRKDGAEASASRACSEPEGVAQRDGEQTAAAGAQHPAGGGEKAAKPVEAPPAADNAMLLQLQVICERFGASPEVSPLMARQLVKRARQLSLERDCSEAAALEYLLNLMAQASQGGGGPQSPL